MPQNDQNLMCRKKLLSHSHLYAGWVHSHKGPLTTQLDKQNFSFQHTSNLEEHHTYTPLYVGYAGTRFSDGDGSSNEVQRTMLELINQLDGFDPRGNIKVLMATNRYISIGMGM